METNTTTCIVFVRPTEVPGSLPFSAHFKYHDVGDLARHIKLWLPRTPQTLQYASSSSGSLRLLRCGRRMCGIYATNSASLSSLNTIFVSLPT